MEEAADAEGMLALTYCRFRDRIDECKRDPHVKAALRLTLTGAVRHELKRGLPEVGIARYGEELEQTFSSLLELE